jgi:hypothetical protein
LPPKKLYVAAAVAATLFFGGLSGPASAVTCGSQSTCTQNPTNFDITVTSPTGVSLIDSWSISPARQGLLFQKHELLQR